MPARTELPKLQHYVPQFLLRRFGTGKKEQLHVFDKRSGKEFVSAVRNVAAERGYYNLPASVASQLWEAAKKAGLPALEGDPPTLSLEPGLANIESQTSKVIERIVREESIANLSANDRGTIALFAAIQFVRAPQHRAMMVQLEDVMRKHVEEMAQAMGRDPGQAAAQAGIPPRGADDHAATHLRHLIAAPQYAPLFLIKHWVLLKAPSGHHLYIGDNPVTLHDNTPPEQRLPFHGIGLGTPGSEVAMPLSSRLCLSMLAPDTAVRVRDTARKRRELAARGLLPPIPAPVSDLLDAVEHGVTANLMADNVTNLNARQVRFASRFVYSTDGRFDLVRQMIQDDPGMREGPRIESG
jgi:hypothetical protein